MTTQKRVAVIGAGPTGLASIKACKEEDVDVVCFERNGHAGGLWRYHDEDIEGVASVTKTTIINTNKELSAFSDFPPPDDFPNFMHHSMMYKYFMMYAEHFDLLRHIRYHKEIVKVVQTEDFKETGQWKVTSKDTKTGKLEEEIFDGVMVCIGHHVFPKIPDFPGQSNFKGEMLHSHSLKNCEGYSGKRIMVVGVGNSGVDAAVDSAFVGDKVYLSTRRGTWLFSRVSERGECYDLAFANRLKVFLGSFRSFDAICDDIEEKLNQRFDHAAYGLKPKHRILSAHPTTNDSLPNLILSGRVVIKPDIERFTEDGVIFRGETEVTELDVVIFATGYHIRFPFLDENIMTTKDNVTELYKHSLPPNLEKPTLAIIALIQPLGPIFPIAEMQGRWFMQIFTGKLKLPRIDEMKADIFQKREANKKRYVGSTRHTIQVDFVPFLDELGGQIGVKPDLLRLAFTDPKLFKACLTGPCLPYQYRIHGPHSWKDAGKTLQTYRRRFRRPLNPNYEEQSKRISFPSSPLYYIIAIAILWNTISNTFGLQ